MTSLKRFCFQAVLLNQTSVENQEAHAAKDTMDGIDQLWVNLEKAESPKNSTSFEVCLEIILLCFSNPTESLERHGSNFRQSDWTELLHVS